MCSYGVAQIPLLHTGNRPDDSPITTLGVEIRHIGKVPLDDQWPVSVRDRHSFRDKKTSRENNQQPNEKGSGNRKKRYGQFVRDGLGKNQYVPRRDQVQEYAVASRRSTTRHRSPWAQKFGLIFEQTPVDENDGEKRSWPIRPKVM